MFFCESFTPTKAQVWIQELENGTRKYLTKYPIKPLRGQVICYKMENDEDTSWKHDGYYPWSNSRTTEVKDLSVKYYKNKSQGRAVNVVRDFNKNVYVKGRFVVAWYSGNEEGICAPHGNAKKSLKPYQPTDTQTLKAIGKLAPMHTNDEILEKLGGRGVRSRSQINHKRYRETKNTGPVKTSKLEIGQNVDKHIQPELADVLGDEKPAVVNPEEDAIIVYVCVERTEGSQTFYDLHGTTVFEPSQPPETALQIHPVIVANDD